MLTNETTKLRASTAELGEHYTVIIHCADLGITVKAYLPEEIQFDARSNYDAPFAQGLNGATGAIGTALKMVGINLTSQALTAQVWQGSEPFEFVIPVILQAESDTQRDVLDPMTNLLRLTMPRSAGSGSLLKAPGPSVDPDKLRENLTQGVRNQIVEGKNKVVQAWNAGSATWEQQRAANEARTGRKTVSGFFTNTSDYLIDGFMAASAAGLATASSVEGVFAPIADLLKASIRNNISLTIGKYMFFESVVITNVQTNHKVQPTVDERTRGNYQHVEVSIGIRTYMTPTQNELAKMFLSAVSVQDVARSVEQSNNLLPGTL